MFTKLKYYIDPEKVKSSLEGLNWRSQGNGTLGQIASDIMITIVVRNSYTP